MLLETHMKLLVTELDFPGKSFLPQKWGKGAKNRPEIGFFEFIGKLSL